MGPCSPASYAFLLRVGHHLSNSLRIFLSSAANVGRHGAVIISPIDSLGEVVAQYLREKSGKSLSYIMSLDFGSNAGETAHP